MIKMLQHKTRNILFILMTSISILLCGTFTLISIIYSRAANSIYINTLVTSQLNVLKEFESYNALLLDSLSELPNQFYQDSMFRKIAQLSVISQSEDLIYILNKTDQILFSNRNISNVCIYLPNSKRMVSTRHGVMTAVYPGYEYVDDWLVNEKDVERIFLKERKSASDNSKRETYTTILIRLSIGQTKPNCVVAIDIEHTDMYKEIINSFDAMDSTMLYVIEDGIIMFSTTNPVRLNESNYARVFESGQQTGYFYTKIDGDKFLTSFYYIKEKNKLYLSLLNNDYVYNNFNGMIVLAALAGLGVVILFLALSFAFYRETTRRIEHVLFILRSHSNTPKEINWLEYLQKSVTGLITENEGLNKRIYESLPELRENFMRNICLGKADKYQEVAKMMKILDIKIPTEPLSLVIMERDDKITGDAMFDNTVLHISIVSLLDIYFKEKKVNIAYYPNSTSEYVIIMDMTALNPDELWGICSDLQECLMKELGICASFIICDKITDIHGLNESSEYCGNIQKYKRLYKRGVILSGLYHKNLSDHQHIYPQAAENRLIGCIRDKDMNGTIECLEEILTFFNNTESLLFMQSFISKLFTKLCDLLKDNLKDPEQVLSHFEYYNYLEKARSVEDINNYLIAVIERTMSAFNDGDNNNSERKCLEIIGYLNENYNKNFSLDTMCNDLDISKSYVNQILRNCANTTFLQELTKIRLDMACDFLTNTKESVAEISEKVGFANSSYFIQTFKKHKGVTPGQYRADDLTVNKKRNNRFSG